MGYVLISNLAYLLVFTILVAILFFKKQQLFALVGIVGYYILVGWVIVFNILNWLWLVNTLIQYLIFGSIYSLGTGGSEYGLNAEIYPYVALLLLSINIPVMVSIVPFAFRRKVIKNEISLRLFTDFRARSNLSKVVFCLTIFLFLLFFYANGWDMIWYSNSLRFEERYTTGLLALMGKSIKFLGTSFLLTGTVGVYLIYQRRNSILGWSVFVFSLVPFMATASRGYSVLFCLLFLSLLFRIKKRVWMLFYLPCFFLLCLTFLLLPLVQRNLGYTGLMSWFEALFYFGKGDFNFWEGFLRILQNVSNGFAILAEVYPFATGYGNPYSSVPGFYKIIVFSPFPSFLDGYAVNWAEYHYRINLFTPINTPSELLLFSPILLYLFYFLIHFTLFTFARRVRILSSLDYAFSALFVGVYCLFLLFSMQYPIRNSMRFLFLTAFMYLFYCSLNAFRRRT